MKYPEMAEFFYPESFFDTTHAADAISLVVERFQGSEEFRGSIGPLRLVCRAWRRAVDMTVCGLSLRVEAEALEGLAVCGHEKFPSLTSLTWSKVGSSQLRPLDALPSSLTNIRTLRLCGFDRTDSLVLSHMGSLREIVAEMSSVDVVKGLDGSLHVRCQQRLSGTEATQQFETVLKRPENGLVSLEQLSVKLHESNASAEMRGIIQKEDLENLKGLVSCAPIEMRTLYSMLQVTSLKVQVPLFSTEGQQCLSQLTNLTALELTLVSPDLPGWIRPLTRLRNLNLTWYFSDDGGRLEPNILPMSLTCLTLRNVNGTPKASFFDQLSSLRKLALSYTHKITNRAQATFENRVGIAFEELHALVSLSRISDLFVQRFSLLRTKNLPKIDHMTQLRNLHVESSGGIDPAWLILLARNKQVQLERLIIGSGLTDEHLNAISAMTSLQTLTLMFSTEWTNVGFNYLTRLYRLRNLSLYHSKEIDVNESTGWDVVESTVTFLFGQFPLLQHLGMFPLSARNEVHLPFTFCLDNRSLTIDGKCVVDTHFGMN